MPQRALGVVFVLLFSPIASIAQTTSGWVLWEKNMVTRTGTESVTWEPMDGFESIADCRQTGQQLLRGALDYMKSGAGKLLGDVRPDGRSAVFEVTNGRTRQTIDIRYLCFPGGLDPRPRETPSRSTK
jgi:hypothetical protein